jgi:phytoene synthase
MQYVNFIRDVSEDLELGRCYFPKSELRKHNLSSLKLTETEKKPENFKAFMREQIKQYLKWQEEGEQGFRFIPPAYVAPIRAASEMYKWTARVIEKDPFVVYRRKVKPSIVDIIAAVTSNVVLCNKVHCAVPHLPPGKEA